MCACVYYYGVARAKYVVPIADSDTARLSGHVRNKNDARASGTWRRRTKLERNAWRPKRTRRRSRAIMTSARENAPRTISAPFPWSGSCRHDHHTIVRRRGESLHERARALDVYGPPTLPYPPPESHATLRESGRPTNNEIIYPFRLGRRPWSCKERYAAAGREKTEKKIVGKKNPPMTRTKRVHRKTHCAHIQYRVSIDAPVPTGTNRSRVIVVISLRRRGNPIRRRLYDFFATPSHVVNNRKPPLESVVGIGVTGHRASMYKVYNGFKIDLGIAVFFFNFYLFSFSLVII